MERGRKILLWLLLWYYYSLRLCNCNDEKESTTVASETGTMSEQEQFTDKLLEHFQDMLTGKGLPRITKGEVMALLEDFAQYSVSKLNRSAAQPRSWQSTNYLSRKLSDDAESNEIIPDRADLFKRSSNPNVTSATSTSTTSVPLLPDARNGSKPTYNNNNNNNSNDDDDDDSSINNNNSSSRAGYERDLMVVLPMMPDSQNLSKSNLEMLYTKTPATEIIYTEDQDEKKAGQQQQQQQPSASAADPNPIETDPDNRWFRNGQQKQNRRPASTESAGEVGVGGAVGQRRKSTDSGRRHPYTEFLSAKTIAPKISKSPLDYGYPETFKFVQELNELPKNHKPEWTITDNSLSPVNTGSTTRLSATSVAPTSDGRLAAGAGATTEDNRNPFQMFESIKPLEINKMLFSGPAEYTESIQEFAENGFRGGPVASASEPVVKATVDQESRASSTTPATGGAKKKPAKKVVAAAAAASTAGPGSSTGTTAVPTTGAKSSVAAHPVRGAGTATTTGRPTAAFPTALLPTLAADNFVRPSVKVQSFLPTPVHVAEKPTVRKESFPAGSTSTETGPIPTVASPDLDDCAKRKNKTSSDLPQPADESADRSEASGLRRNVSFICNQTTSSPPPSPPPPPSNGTVGLSPMLLFENGKSPAENEIQQPEESEQERLPIATDMLNKEMKNVLVALGILKSDDYPAAAVASTSAGPPRLSTSTSADYRFADRFRNPTIDPNSYVNFKKIPTGYEDEDSDDDAGSTQQKYISNDMKDFLASFGLLSGNKQRKGSRSRTRISRQQQALERPQNAEDLASLQADYYVAKAGFPGKSSSDHVFRPAAQLEELNNAKSVQRINDIVENIKKLSEDKTTRDLSNEEIQTRLENITSLLNSTANQMDRSVLNDMISSIVLTEHGAETAKSSEKPPRPPSDEIGDSSNQVTVVNSPNPLSTEELNQMYEASKNDVKRQQPQTTAPAAATPTTPTTLTALTTLTTTTSASSSSSTAAATTGSGPKAPPAIGNNAPLPELAASFGGGDTASELPSQQDLPTARPNGLYFYLDWNSFLNVGEADKRPVNIRFAPKAGNARNFIPITFP